MSVGVTLPHFTSPSSNGGQIGFFFISTRVDTQKKNGGTLALTLKKKYKKYIFFLSVMRVHWCDTFLHSRDTSPTFIPPYIMSIHTPRCVSILP